MAQGRSDSRKAGQSKKPPPHPSVIFQSARFFVVFFFVKTVSVVHGRETWDSARGGEATPSFFVDARGGLEEKHTTSTTYDVIQSTPSVLSPFCPGETSALSRSLHRSGPVGSFSVSQIEQGVDHSVRVV